jgi:hypothetical protein|tara:strand:+ start:801 stop:1337 length:537 start_codon:yes stop_codon:yes gene_type:complete
MALTGKKYEKFYSTSGGGDDEVKSDSLTKAEAIWDHYRAKGMDLFFDDFKLSPLIYQLQQMQDELDYLRTEISNNKDKTGITTSQANAIVANTAKDSMVLGTTAKTALAGNTALLQLGTTKDTALAGNTVIPTVTVNSGKNIEILFDNLQVGQKSTTIDLKVADTSTKKTYSATITLK